MILLCPPLPIHSDTHWIMFITHKLISSYLHIIVYYPDILFFALLLLHSFRGLLAALARVIWSLSHMCHIM
ncbi:hypothetical protein EDB19DRAFT_825688 [Suillus lakei]|nr:hypothetical protein EDB19DRAFT_825688 [Suillus lakei]